VNQRTAARLLRRLQTPAEERLWSALRRHQLEGLQFRRQHPLGGFIADFYCHEAHLAVEVDGGIHSQPNQAAWDRDRDAAFALMGIAVRRVTNDHVMSALDGVLESIRESCRSRVDGHH
jgi:very-short-patch-repair endonuclease